MMLGKQWPALACALLILIISGIPSNQIPEIPTFLNWLSPDKIVHVIIFGVLSYLILFGNRQQYLKCKNRSYYIIIAVLLSAVYGLITELLQYFVFIGRNAKFYKLERQKQKNLIDPDRHKKRILKTLMEDLRMSEQPVQIECFDNSNFQGDYPVAAMVQFIDTKPNKSAYRHFNIKTVKGPDDYASMEEVIYRRYSRLLKENRTLPQLIVVDGGKGQLNAAVKSLNKLNLYGKIAVIGIAKRLEELYFPNDPVPLYLDKKSESLKVIQQLRDEAHRFGITHHRSQLEKGTIKSELTSIDGIGFSTAQKLLWKFRSVKKIKEAKLDELIKVVGKSKAEIVFSHFSKKTNE